MPSPIISISQKQSTEETWATALEEEPLIEAAKAKQASIASRSPPTPAHNVVDPAPAPPGTAPIQLPPDVDLSAEYPFNDQPISTPRSGESNAQRPTFGWNHMSTDTKSVLRYIGRGCLIVLVTPIAFTGMALYASGAILEGVAMVMKGAGAAAGNLMMSRRAEVQKSPVIQPSVAWV